MTEENIALKHYKLSEFEPTTLPDGVSECRANTEPYKYKVKSLRITETIKSLPNISLIENSELLTPQNLEPIAEKELADVLLSLTYNDLESTPAINVPFLLSQNGKSYTGQLDEFGKAVVKSIPKEGEKTIYFYHEYTPTQIEDSLKTAYIKVEAELKLVNQTLCDSYLEFAKTTPVKEKSAYQTDEQIQMIEESITEYMEQLKAESNAFDALPFYTQTIKISDAAQLGFTDGVSEYIPDLDQFGLLMDELDINLFDMSEIIFNGDIDAINKIEEKLQACEKNRCAVDLERAKETMETLILLTSDKRTREILLSLPKQFLENMPTNKLVEISVKQGTQYGIDTAVTASSIACGPGAVACGAVILTATSSRKAGKALEGLVKALGELSPILKQKRNKAKSHENIGNNAQLKTKLPDDKANKEKQSENKLSLKLSQYGIICRFKKQGKAA